MMERLMKVDVAVLAFPFLAFPVLLPLLCKGFTRIT